MGLSLERRLKQSANEQLVALTRKESDYWKDLRAVANALKTQAVRVKTDGVKENIEWLTTLLNAYGKARDNVFLELKTRLEVASRSTASSKAKITERMKVMEKRFMGILGLAQDKLAKQEGALMKVSMPGQPQPY